MNELQLDIMSWKYSVTHMTNEFKAWCAGFFDGEGCVMITRRQRSPNFIEHFVAAVIGQKDITPLESIKSAFGGTLTKRTTSNCFQWRAHGGTAERFYKAIRGHLRLKCGEVDCALAIRKTVGKPSQRITKDCWQKREEIWKEFRRIRDSKCTTSFQIHA